MGTINHRLLEVCERKNLRKVDLVNMGCGSQATVGNVLNHNHRPNIQFIEVFLNHNLDVDARWLCTGKPEALDMVAEGETPYAKNCMDCIRKDAIIAYQKETLEKQEKEKERLSQEVGRLKEKCGESANERAS